MYNTNFVTEKIFNQVMCVLYIRNLKQSVKLNEDMEKVQEWCTSNDMVINTMKSKSMIIGSSRKIQYLESDFNIFHDDVLLNDVKYEKLLGITIDNCLSWCQQINNIVSKISSRFGLMCGLRTYLPTEGLIMYYNGYILSL